MPKPKTSSKNHKWIEIKESGSLVIRFNYQSKPYKFSPVKGGRYDNPKDTAIANRIASEIEQSVKLGNFTGLEQWKPRTLVEPVNPWEPTLKEIWTEYKFTKSSPIWVERLDFSQGENIYTEDYQEISYKKYRKLRGKGQILKNY